MKFTHLEYSSLWNTKLSRNEKEEEEEEEEKDEERGKKMRQHERRDIHVQ